MAILRRTHPDAWAELAEFEQCEPSPLAFRALVGLLETWPGDDRADAIEAAGKILQSWPDSARLAPWSWCKAVARGTIMPTWQLVRGVQLMPGHLGKGKVDLARLAHFADLSHITELEIPTYSDFQEVSFLYHRPQTFPALKKLRVVDKHDDGEIRALADSPLWRTLETFESQSLTDSFAHGGPSRIVPRFQRGSPLKQATLRGRDLISLWDSGTYPKLRSVCVFLRTVDEARALAGRAELSKIMSLSIAFRGGFRGSSSFEPFLGNVIDADEEAANLFFRTAKLDRLESLSISGYSMGYWGREGLGPRGLKSLIASGLLQRLKHLRLELLPLGDDGVAALAGALSDRLETLELRDVYCKEKGARALAGSPCLASLKTLDLSGNRIDADSFAALAKAEMPRLERVDFSGPRINPYYWNIGQQPMLDAGAIAWGNSPNLRRVKSLRFRNCHLSDAALVAIFQSPHLGALEQLDLSDNAFSQKGIAKGVVGSPLWQTLREVGLSHCRLDNAAIVALTQVPSAPRLRSLELGYNNLGPAGAVALARWPVLARVWHLGLHDNAIGDDGLIALAKSPHLTRLVELDLEQDCWNSRTFTFDDAAAKALAKSKSLGRLDAVFSGCVDEYHGAAYSPGFSKDALHLLRKSPGHSAAFRVAIGDFSGIGDYIESGPFRDDKPYSGSDFRQSRPKLNEREAESTGTAAQSMRQIGSKSSSTEAPDDPSPPKILPALAELDLHVPDQIEGIEHLDPMPRTDRSLNLHLPMKDRRRPLPTQAGGVLTDVVGGIFRAGSIGRFDFSGSSSEEGPDGQMRDTECFYSIGIPDDPEPALRILRECLWWIGAPGKTRLEKIPLKLTTPPAPAVASSRFAQLAAYTVFQWKSGPYSGHRLDRVVWDAVRKKAIAKILKSARGAKGANGWVDVATPDGGRMSADTRYLADSPDFDVLNLLFETLTPQISGLVHRMMLEADLLLWPMAIAAKESSVATPDVAWPKIEVIATPGKLHQLLDNGPYHRWQGSEI
jgi:Leucine Rich repeat